MYPTIANEWKLYNSYNGSLQYLCESGAVSRPLFFKNLNTDFDDWLKHNQGSYRDYLNEKYIQYNGYQSYRYEQDWLYEGLMYSASPKSVKYYLEKIKRVSVTIMKFIIIEVPRSLYPGLESDLTHKLNVLGWYIVDSDYGNNSNIRTLIIDSRYNEFERTYEIIDDYNDTVYHITTAWFAEKILKVGLCPKCKDKKAHYPERVYAYLTNNPMACATLANDLYHDLDPIDIVLLKIDLSKNKPAHPRFYTDNFTSNQGVYTLENISPDCISVADNNLEFQTCIQMLRNQ